MRRVNAIMLVFLTRNPDEWCRLTSVALGVESTSWSTSPTAVRFPRGKVSRPREYQAWDCASDFRAEQGRSRVVDCPLPRPDCLERLSGGEGLQAVGLGFCCVLECRRGVLARTRSLHRRQRRLVPERRSVIQLSTAVYPALRG